MLNGDNLRNTLLFSANNVEELWIVIEVLYWLPIAYKQDTSVTCFPAIRAQESGYDLVVFIINVLKGV